MTESIKHIAEEPENTPQTERKINTPEGVTLHITSTGPRYKSQKDGVQITIQVNQEKFEGMAHAHRFGALKLAQTTQLKSLLQRGAKKLLEETKNNPNLARILQLQGLKNLKQTQPQLLDEMGNIDPTTLTLTEAFDFACEQYVMKGQFPENLPQEVKDAIDSIPKVKKGSHKGLSFLDALISEEYEYKIEQRLFQKIELIRRELKEKEAAEAKKYKYKPQVKAGESEPIDPESIETKVSPFYGGYYRGYACHFEPDLQEIVQETCQTKPFELSEDIDMEKLKVYTYETNFDPEKVIEIPYNAIPLKETLTPNNLAIHRAINGAFYIKPKARAAGNVFGETNDQDPIKQKISFQFVIAPTKDNGINDTPDKENAVWGNLDQDAENFITSLQATFSTYQKAKACEAYTRKRFKYPEDENARAEMNANYLSSGQNSLQAMCEHGIADCYWSNIFAGQLMARLGINHRVIAGHYVTKDPRFEFAAVAGIGHAWSEIWDGTSWQRIDATPAKEEPDEQEEPEEQEEQDGDFGEEGTPPEEQEELSIEEIRALFDELINEETNATPPHTPEEIFEQKTGVSFLKWKEVERYVQEINRTVIPASSSISGKQTTIEQEWERLFDLIYQRREIPIETVKGPVRQSEGEELDDPVDAVIDILSGELDPSGYKMTAEQTEEQVFVTSFEDDSILDLTQSMEGTPAQEQKKMILSGLYNLMILNRRLNLDSYKKKMHDPVALRSRIYTFKGNAQVTQALDTEEIIDEKALCAVYDELEKLKIGQGNLVGALRAYESKLTETQIKRMRAKKLVKVLTIISDGAIANSSEAVQIIQSLRAKGVIVQGIGFGNAAQDIKVICHDPKDPKAADVIDDVTQGVGVRHGMLSKALKKL